MLIIEDDWLIADYIEHLARDAGATSIAIADCESDAIEAARGDRPAIIVSDVNLRAGTGPHAVQTIEAQWGPIPVIFITATPEQCTPRQEEALILSKPFSPKALTDAIKRLAPGCRRQIEERASIAATAGAEA